ncbi:SCO family protein [Caldalkalibacillus salinus]|uniref:SCO family protein n=1 Tax=Caldalkalibacillus salinus TaxID=2803787 RepID=UPI00192155F6|nr:SCO family protein [Caldalkalibacillus salinus]
MKHRLYVIISCATFSILLLVACGQTEIKERLDWAVDEDDEFTAVNEEGEPVTISDYHGEVWLAYFMFTSCDTVCPMMTTNMIELQERLEAKGLKPPIVALTVDPKRDTPDVLQEYRQQHSIDPEQWDFLTGYTREEVKDLAEDFNTVLEEMTDTDQYLHGTRFYLIDQKGVIAKTYSGLQEIPFEQMVQDTKALSQ